MPGVVVYPVCGLIHSEVSENVVHRREGLCTRVGTRSYDKKAQDKQNSAKMARTGRISWVWTPVTEGLFSKGVSKKNNPAGGRGSSEPQERKSWMPRKPWEHGKYHNFTSHPSI